MQDDESEISHTRLAYLPALDGMRAAAVFAVMMFHGGISFMNGGFMGVDAFFVLSGFLITSLLVGEWRQTMTIKLASFWARRARRLLPALLLMLLFVAFFASVIVPEGTYGALRLDALSTLLYVSNWHFILVGSNYFNETASASPLIHTWSLAVEEQFYLIWPLVVLAVLHFTKSLKVLLGVCIAAGVASAVEMAVLYDPTDVNRVYLGTDTRAQCLFIGCALAVALVVVTQRHHEEGRLAAGQLWRPATQLGHALCGVAGIVGAAGAILIWVLTDETSSFPYSGGFFLVGLCTASVILAAVGRAAQRGAAPPLGLPRALRRPHFVRHLHLALATLPLDQPPAHRARRLPPLLRAGAGHARRRRAVLPPGRAADPHGHLPPSVAGLGGGARGRRRGGGRADRGHGGHLGAGQHDLPRIHRTLGQRGDGTRGDHDHGGQRLVERAARAGAALRRFGRPHARRRPRGDVRPEQVPLPALRQGDPGLRRRRRTGGRAAR